MRAVLPRPAVLCISVASLLAGACTDPQTLMAPVDVQSAVSIMAKPAGPSIASNSGSGVFAIGGTAVSVSLVVDNPSKNGYSNAAAVLTLTQGSATRDLGRYALNCAEAAPGVLPAGTTCSFSVPAAVPAGGGTGSLEAGSAALVATLVQTSGRKDKVLASSSETVTLTQAGGPGGDPSITYFRLHSTSIPLGGAVQYSITIDNPGTATLHPFIVQAVLRQGITEYGAGGTEVPCSGAESGLPPGSCSFSYQTTAPAAASAGVATLEIQIMDEHDILDVRSVPVTLTASGPHIEMIRLASTEFTIGGPSVAYRIWLMNPLAEIYPAAVQAWITQGSTQAAAGGTQTRCPGYTDGTLHTGLCFFDSSANADSGAAIDGSLLPGPAVLTIELRDFFGVRHTWQGDITLVGGT